MRYYTLFTVRWRGLGLGPAGTAIFPGLGLAGASGQRRFAMPQALCAWCGPRESKAQVKTNCSVVLAGSAKPAAIFFTILEVFATRQASLASQHRQ